MPTDDYINRSDALNTIHSVPPGNWSRARYMDAVEKVPAADVEPVRHGWWEHDSDDIPHCSECGTIALQRHKLYLEEKIYDVSFVLSKRCPECGAKLEE